ncbi:lisH domain-containing protein ARMC9 isoform X1 [Megalopta genalis]|uniref:lisH domain-containing protein ARMC9 isoform X1 n=1 Tax=Megalopta genalis TaxID=115081 RepID=UPI003FD58D76
MDKNRIIDQMDNKNLKLIHQFLIDHKFENTAETLLIEVESRSSKSSSKDQRILLSFDSGDWRTFFNIWNLLVPENVKQTRSYKVLTLNLYVYFIMLPKHKMILHSFEEQDKMQTETIKSTTSLNHNGLENQENFMTELEKDMHECVELLRVFLNTTGKELEDDTELRSLIALILTEDPLAELSMSKVFGNSWIKELTENLISFVEDCEQQNFSNLKHNDINSENKDSPANKILEKRNVPIIPNDRNIPLFIEDDEIDEQYCLSDNTKYTRKSKSVQTISTIYSTDEDLHSSLLRSNKKLMQYAQELTVTTSHLSTVQSNYEKLKKRFHKLHADYHKLMSIARVLTNVLENSVKGQTIDFQAMLESCIKIFPDLFNQNIRDNSYCPSEAMLEKCNSEMKVIKQPMPYMSSAPPKSLNFKKIKLHLINGSIKTKLLLLQALRRKVTCGQPGEREEALHEYISKDLLGLYGRIASYKGTSILPYLLTPDNISMPHPLQQSTTRLLNALASFRCGRDYLSFDSTVVDAVFKCLNNTYDNDIDTFTCNMMIAMLQKLSLRKQQRIYMIENGLVEWLIRHLHVHYRIMDSYRLEYATALLMNLSLHQIARRRASTLASLLVSTLTNLLLTDRSSILPYITGALNHFLTNHDINEEAKKMKFSSVLEQYSKYKDGEIREHLEHILKIHKGDVMIKTEIEEIADNDDEEFDVVENELEENDPVKNNYGELSGETLLASCYTTSLKAFHDKEINSEISSHTFMHDAEEQVKSLHYEHASVSNEQNFERFVDKTYHVKNRNNIVMVQERMKELQAPKLVSLHKAQQINKPRINEKWSFPSDARSTLESSAFLSYNCAQRNLRKINKQITANPSNDKKFRDTSTVNAYLRMENDTISARDNCESAEYFRKDTKTTLASSMNLDENDVGSVANSTVMEKLSSIASLNASDDNKAISGNTWYAREIELDTEDAFLAKPKLPRTPP